MLQRLGPRIQQPPTLKQNDLACDLHLRWESWNWTGALSPDRGQLCTLRDRQTEAAN